MAVSLFGVEQDTYAAKESCKVVRYRVAKVPEYDKVEENKEVQVRQVYAAEPVVNWFLAEALQEVPSL